MNPRSNIRSGPGGFMWSQRTWRSPDRQQDTPGGNPGHPHPIDPGSEQEIFQRFQETIDMLTGLRYPNFGPPGGRPAPPSGGSPGGGGPGMRSTTYRSPSGHTSFTITTGAMPLRGVDHDDGFDMTFRNFMDGGGAHPPRAQNAGLAGGLGDLFSLLLGPGAMNAAHGDAVYTQEGLDRIITQLMEANPQSNAAPPASESAIEKLEKKSLDRQMMGDSPKVECTICIDEMHLGDEVTVLPCKHWFHGECVVLWLKEHNTCPICRTPIEKRGENSNGGNSGNGDNGTRDGSGNQQQPRIPGARPGPFGALFSAEPFSPQGGPGSSAAPGSQQYNTRGARTPEDRERRLNSIRNLTGASSYGTSASDSSRYGGQRRDSWSPTSPGPTSVASARNRSPPGPRARLGRANSSGLGECDSQPSSRDNSSSSGNAGGSSNPLSWIRDRISGSGGSASGNNNGRRRS